MRRSLMLGIFVAASLVAGDSFGWGSSTTAQQGSLLTAPALVGIGGAIFCQATATISTTVEIQLLDGSGVVTFDSGPLALTALASASVGSEISVARAPDKCRFLTSNTSLAALRAVSITRDPTGANTQVIPALPVPVIPNATPQNTQ